MSVDKDGTEREFLRDYIDEDKILLYQFRKGYQWPFTSSNIPGSSEIDIAVQNECAKGRDVFMDFIHNPYLFNGTESLPEEARNYLVSSGALQDTPIERLEHMNPAAIKLYKDNGIDITREKLRVAVCAQHCNGGIGVDSDWQTSINGLYVAGEAAGTFGVHRPGGAALNSTQVGSMRAAEHIAYKKEESVHDTECVVKEAQKLYARIEKAFSANGESLDEAERIRSDMSSYAANIRCVGKIRELQSRVEALIAKFFDEYDINYRKTADSGATLKALVNTSKANKAALSSMEIAAQRYGSRGSCMTDNNDSLLNRHEDENCIVVTQIQNGACSFVRKVHDIPERDGWFETAWADYKARTGRI